MMTTVLVQTDRPADAGNLVNALRDALASNVAVAEVEHTLGAYDLVARIVGDTDAIARAVIAAQGVDGVARTLTLAHVSREASP